MKRIKIQLSEEDLALGPAELKKKYGLSSRGHAHYILKKGYFWENYLQIEENFSSIWFEENFKEIEKCAKSALSFKVRQKRLWDINLFLAYKEDIYQECLIYMFYKAGEIQSGKIKMINIACNGIDHAIDKYFFHGDGKNTTVAKFVFEDEIINAASSEDEDNIDEIFSHVQDYIVSFFGEKAWEKVWSWAKSGNCQCPENISKILKTVVL